MSEVESAPTWTLLREIVDEAEYRPRWHLSLTSIETDSETGRQSARTGGLRLDVHAVGYDSYHPERGPTYGVRHSFIVPAASYNRQSWIRWLLDRLIDIETHETCEFFRVGGKRPFAPNHGPGWNPYGVRELNATEAAETTFRGERREGTQQ